MELEAGCLICSMLLFVLQSVRFVGFRVFFFSFHLPCFPCLFYSSAPFLLIESFLSGLGPIILVRRHLDSSHSSNLSHLDCHCSSQSHNRQLPQWAMISRMENQKRPAASTIANGRSDNLLDLVFDRHLVPEKPTPLVMKPETVRAEKPLDGTCVDKNILFAERLMARIPEPESGYVGKLFGEDNLCKELVGAPHTRGKGEGFRSLSMCAGTDSPILGLSSIVTAGKRVYGKNLKYSHAWSAEWVESKRGFLENMYSADDLPAIYKDVADLLHVNAREHRTNADQVIDKSPEVGAAGFPCTDVSGMNP